MSGCVLFSYSLSPLSEFIVEKLINSIDKNKSALNLTADNPAPIAGCHPKAVAHSVVVL
jgi:hypothetical protein